MKKINFSDIPKKEPFEAPEGYLEQLPYQIQQRLQAKQPAQSAPLAHWLLLPKLQWGLSLVVLLLVGGMLFYQQPATSTAPDAHALLEEVSEEELMQYLQSSTSLSMQEITSEASWSDDDNVLQAYPEEHELEDEVLKNIDTYTADEIWK